MYGETVVGNYRFCQRYCLGQGAFGKVYKGYRLTDDLEVAIKEIDLSLSQDKSILNEIATLSKLEHPNVVRYYDAVRTHHSFYIITEYCSGGDLANAIGSDEQDNHNEQAALDMFFQICQGFDYLKKNNIMHRDLKPANILIHKGVYKIGDFGLAKSDQMGNSVMAKSYVGAPMYMSPQMLSCNMYTYKCDVWSLGVIFFEMLYGQLPWKTNDSSQLLFKIMDRPCPYQHINRKISETSLQILDGTLRYLENQRLGWSQLLALKKKRRKIFEQPEIKVHHTNSLPTPKVSLIDFDFDDFDYNSIENDLPKYIMAILKHIYNQFFSNRQQIIQLAGKQCCQALMFTCSEYMKQGSKHKDQFYDCCKVFLKMSSANISTFMLKRSNLKDTRQVLVMLEVIHDFITLEGTTEDDYMRVFSGSNIKSMQQFVPKVLKKINGFAQQC